VGRTGSLLAARYGRTSAALSAATACQPFSLPLSNEPLSAARRVDERIHPPGVPSRKVEREFSVSEATIAGLATLVDTPGFDGINPAADKLFVLLDDEVKERTAHDFGRLYELVVRTVFNPAVAGKAVQKKGSTDGLRSMAIELHGLFTGVGGW
jgi:hypothetical protein